MDIHIFAAEDDEHIGNAIKAFLLDAGYNVELCPDGQAACERLYDKKFHIVQVSDSGRKRQCPFRDQKFMGRGVSGSIR